MSGRGQGYGIEARVAPASAPATFLERGVVMPFTTPLLAGCRLRVQPGGDRQELIVGNPATGQGIYILPWDGIRTLCSPTLHDCILYEGVRVLRSVTPFSVQDAALQVAEQGAAGRPAAAAAAAARAAQARYLQATHAELLRELVRQACGSGKDDAELPVWTTQAYALVAPQVGLPRDRLPILLQQLAAALAPVGIGAAAATAPMATAAAAVAALHDALRAAFGGLAPATRLDAWLVMEAAGATLDCVRPALSAARGLVHDLPRLLRAWAQAPETVTVQVERSGWLLNGWRAICVLWDEDPKLDSPLLREMANIVPDIPPEAASLAPGGSDCRPSAAADRHRAPELQHGGDGRLLLELIARNERLLARTLMAA